MDEIVKSIKAFLYDRTVSPLFGAYACAWSIWNYRVILAIFDGDATLDAKKNFIDDYFGLVFYYVGNHTYYLWGQIVHGILGPVLLTLFYLYVYPKLAKPVYKYSLKKQKELTDIKQESENLRLLTNEESRNIIKEIEQLRQKADEDTKKYRERIASLTETINALEANQNSAPLDTVTEPIQEEPLKEKLDLEELANLLGNKIQEHPIGEFELAELFSEADWGELNDASRKEYGKLFKKLVDRGDFANIAVSKKGTRNQLIYLKKEAASSKELSAYQKILTTKINLEPIKSNESNDSISSSLIKIATYLIKANISEDMLNIFIEMVKWGEAISEQELFKRFAGDLTRIEFDHILKKLENTRILSHDSNYRVILTDKGKEAAVESGLISLIKKSRG
jgi:hypothetical protein